MKKKLLVICGPTATGKTQIAIDLAKQIGGELVSADSRQVYKNMDIGTGKDLGENAKYELSKIKFNKRNIGFYKIEGVNIWGLDIVYPHEDFSVSHYERFSKKIIKYLWQKGKLPILVGGTGFYIKSVIDQMPLVSVPIDNNLRKGIMGKSTSELYEILLGKNPQKAILMNPSDRKNPRRLIRAIEIAQWLIDKRRSLPKSFSGKDRTPEKVDLLFIGLKAPRSELARKIKDRISKRLKDGIKEEILDLLKSGNLWTYKSMSSIGYQEWKDFFEEEKEEKEVLEKWKINEINYSKRQMTWFLKDKRIIWFDITILGWEKRVEKLVKRWYKSVYAEKS